MVLIAIVGCGKGNSSGTTGNGGRSGAIEGKDGPSDGGAGASGGAPAAGSVGTAGGAGSAGAAGTAGAAGGSTGTAGAAAGVECHTPDGIYACDSRPDYHPDSTYPHYSDCESDASVYWGKGPCPSANLIGCCVVDSGGVQIATCFYPGFCNSSCSENNVDGGSRSLQSLCETGGVAAYGFVFYKGTWQTTPP